MGSAMRVRCILLNHNEEVWRCQGFLELSGLHVVRFVKNDKEKKICSSSVARTANYNNKMRHVRQFIIYYLLMQMIRLIAVAQ